MWNYIFTNVFDEEAAEKCGSFIRAEVTSGEFKGTEVSTMDPVSAILDIQGVSSILFLVNHSEQEKEKLSRNSLALLYGGSTLNPLPDWKGASIVATRCCPNRSNLHEVKRTMLKMNLALYGFACERPLIDPVAFPGMEAMFRQTRSTNLLVAWAFRLPLLPTIRGLCFAGRTA